MVVRSLELTPEDRVPDTCSLALLGGTLRRLPLLIEVVAVA